MATERRLLACVEAWPACYTGGYDPRCCRFPKSCSATIYDPSRVTDDDLEPERPLPAVRGVVEVLGPSQGLTVGPDEVLVVVLPEHVDRYDVEAVRDRMRDAGLRPDQILLFAGRVTIGKAPRDQIRVVQAPIDGEVSP